ncbi:hypothetical protein HanIR_Chr16g0801031 [Helianthus annuus]|nr:hypothetical protein HanIR_Chr16g0801031 [Helianthus annuus]
MESSWSDEDRPILKRWLFFVKANVGEFASNIGLLISPKGGGLLCFYFLFFCNQPL